MDIILKEVEIGVLEKNHLHWLKDKDVNKYLDTKNPSIESCKRYIAKHTLNPYSKMFYINVVHEIKNMDTLTAIGTVTVSGIDFENNSAEIGIMIGDKQYWGKGVAQEVVQQIRTRLKNKYGITKLKLGVIPGNFAAINCYKKCGFEIKEILMEVE